MPRMPKAAMLRLDWRSVESVFQALIWSGWATGGSTSHHQQCSGSCVWDLRCRLTVERKVCCEIWKYVHSWGCLSWQNMCSVHMYYGFALNVLFGPGLKHGGSCLELASALLVCHLLFSCMRSCAQVGKWPGPQHVLTCMPWHVQHEHVYRTCSWSFMVSFHSHDMFIIMSKHAMTTCNSHVWKHEIMKSCHENMPWKHVFSCHENMFFIPWKHVLKTNEQSDFSVSCFSLLAKVRYKPWQSSSSSLSCALMFGLDDVSAQLCSQLVTSSAAV